MWGVGELGEEGPSTLKSWPLVAKSALGRGRYFNYNSRDAPLCSPVTTRAASRNICDGGLEGWKGGELS